MEKAYQFRDFFIPDYMMGAITRYVEKGIPPGGFLTAVISNDLAGAVSRADDTNIRNLPAYVGYFYNHLPSQCWGSPERMKRWTEERSRELAAKANADPEPLDN